MFNYLLDSARSYVGGEGSLLGAVRWRRVVDAFQLKYPDVNVCFNYLRKENLGLKVPYQFIVWRLGKANGNDRPRFENGGWKTEKEGTYVVQFFPISGSRFDISAYAKRNHPNGTYVVKEAAAAGEKTVITDFGLFEYEPPVGELGVRPFPEMVLNEDKSKVWAMGNRVSR
ncbi:MAG TPA: hypothetical protein PKD55_24850 [Bellilinea sp.]|nr:hypothetical protein [Bellilinea sp.]